MAAEINEAVRHVTADLGDYETQGGIPMRWIHSVDPDLGYNPSVAKSGEIVFDGSNGPQPDPDNLKGPLFTGTPQS